MAYTFDATPAAVPAQPSQAQTDPVKLRDEIHRLQQRLLRARESYDQDLFSGDAEVPLDEQLKSIATYSARLDDLTAQLRQHETGAAAPAVPSPAAPPAPEVDAPYVPTRGPVSSPTHDAGPTGAHREPAPAQLPQPQLPQPRHAQAPAPAPVPAPAQAPAPVEPEARRQPIPGPGITNPDGSPLVSDGTLIRTEEGAIGEYIRFAAEQRWVASSRPAQAAGYTAMCDLLLAALAHKHGVTPDEERASLVRHVDARYRRDYG